MPSINDTLDLIRKAQASPSEELKKSFVQSTGLVAYDLEAPAKTMYPVLTPLRNRIGRVKSNAGDTATRWKAITAINTANQQIGVSEGNRGAVIAETVTNYTAPYVGIGLENSVSFESEYASEGFDDVDARATQSLLRSVMIGEEAMILGGNGSMALGTTPTPSVSSANTGGTIANGTYDVICVALTPDAYRRWSVGATGLGTGTFTKTNADGTSDTVPGGIAQKSATSSTVSPTGTATISASVAAVQGAAAYAWYVGTAGAEKLAAITTINSVLLTALPAGGNQLASALPSADNSAQTGFAFDGLLTFALKSGSGATVISQATGTAGTGTPLTSDSKGGIVEFDTLLGTMWDSYKLQPKRVLLHRQDLINLSKKIVSGTSNQFHFNVTNGTGQAGDATDMAGRNRGGIVGGSVVTQYVSPIDGSVLELAVHPNAIQGTILFETDEVPYPTSNVGVVYRIKCRRDYYQLLWPLVTRKRQFGCYADEVLQHYFPPALGAIVNVANG